LVARELRLRAFTLLAAVAGLAGRRLRFESFARLLRLVAAGVAAVGLLRRVAGLALILPALLLLAGRRLLLRRRILREVLFEKVAVEARVVVLRVELERAVVRGDRALDHARARERVAAVVVRLRGVDAGKGTCARRVIAGAVLRGRTPFRILEEPRGLLRTLRGEGLHAALVWATPEGCPSIGEADVRVDARASGGLLRERRRLRHEHEERDDGDPAAPEAERDERQQQHREIKARVLPHVGDARVLVRLDDLACVLRRLEPL